MNESIDSGPTLQFLGAAGTVTGSRHLVRHRGKAILLDCGLFQGLKALRQRNWDRFPLKPRDIDAVVISHAHIDHVGYLPVLVRNGFRGTIHCTKATAELLALMLMDSAKVQEEDAEQANRHGYSKHHPALPLYTTEDVAPVLKRVRSQRYGKPFGVTDQVQAVYRRTGHILGAASVELQLGPGEPRRVVFSGDLGRYGSPILRDPEPVPAADVLLCESTYGDRLHPADPPGEVARIVHEAVQRGGALIVPAFALGRTQELIWALRKLEDEGRIPVLPVWIDSPMAREVTEVYAAHPDEHDDEMRQLTAAGPFRTHNMAWADSRQESKALNEVQGPVIIISASGMATGGRVLHHLARRLPDPRTTVLLVGYQAEDTRGRKLLEGARSVKIHGREIPVAARVEKVNGLSAHADRDEILRWLGGFERPPRKCYLVHGEPRTATALATTIHERLGWDVAPAVDGETVGV